MTQANSNANLIRQLMDDLDDLGRPRPLGKKFLEFIPKFAYCSCYRTQSLIRSKFHQQVLTMSLYANLSPIFLDKVIGLLVPLFLTTAGGDDAAAREAAESALASYDVETEEEIRLAAEITNFGFGALEALSRSMDPSLSLNAILRLRGSANALHRSAHQCQRALDKLRKERSLHKIDARTKTANPDQSATQPVDTAESSPARLHPEIVLSRQQRRAIQRQTDKAQRRQAEQARRDAMRALRRTPSFATQAMEVPILAVSTLAASSGPHGSDQARVA